MNRIKIAMLINDMNINGISMVVMNYCRNLDKSKFDVSIISGAPIDDLYKTQCTANQIKYYELPSRKNDQINYYRAIRRALKEKFDIVHIHGNSATISVELLLAKLAGIKIRIAHSHNTSCSHMKAHKILLPLFNHVYTHGIACSDLAGKWLFEDKEFFVLPDGFDTERFKFDDELRKQARKELGLNEGLIIGHVGRFNNQKNHPFLLAVFEEIAGRRKDAYLLLVGNGPDFERIMELIDNHPYKDRIIVYGESNDTPKLYAAMDVFVLPSKHEGFGIVLLEAQINGLYSVTSSVVPDEVIITDNIRTIDLEKGPKIWADYILDVPAINRSGVYSKYRDVIENYDIKSNVKCLEKLYQEFVSEKTHSEA